jgi:hypothetical protein
VVDRAVRACPKKGGVVLKVPAAEQEEAAAAKGDRKKEGFHKIKSWREIRCLCK